jgi:hypothetical protein
MKKLKLPCAILLLFSVPVIACLGIFLMEWGNSYAICFSTPFPSYNDVERSAYLKFPPSAQHIEFDANGINRKAGCTIWVKFEMESQELDVFKATIRTKQLSSSKQLGGDAFDFFSRKQGWVQPSTSLAGYWEINSSENQWVFIDTSQPDTWTVYLITNKEWL